MTNRGGLFTLFVTYIDGFRGKDSRFCDVSLPLGVEIPLLAGDIG